jgi:predicted Zn finger-like uncharacterized protein
VKISCPACQAKYSIADEKVTDRLAKIRCRKCGATIVIDGKTRPASVYTAAGDAPDTASAVEQDATGSQYSVDFGEGDQRNMTVAEIVMAYNGGQISAETYLWADGFADWKALGEIDEIVDALQAATLAAPTLSAATATPSPWAAPAANAPRAAARPARAAAADLFGGIESAGSEDDVTTSAPEHAAAGGSLALGLGSSATGNSSTGARNESSVLFSLSALTSASSPIAASRPASRPPAGASSRDDSGLIDLKALTAAATKNEGSSFSALSTPLGVESPLGIASPLGMASPLGGGYAASADPAAQQGGGKSKTGLYIGGALVLCAAIVGAAIVLKPAPAPPPPAPVAVAPVPTPEPTPAAAPVITATPPATGTVQEPAPSAKQSAAGPVLHHAASAPKKSASGSTAGAAEAAPAAAAAPKPKKSACGCAPGDLMCNMQCSAR